MRGFLSPALRNQTSELQDFFTTLSRSRRTKLARAASTNLLKADQWARGDATATPIASALENQAKTHQATRK